MADRYDVEAEVDALITPGYRSGTVYRTELLAALSRAREAGIEEALAEANAVKQSCAVSRDRAPYFEAAEAFQRSVDAIERIEARIRALAVGEDQGRG